MMTETFLLDGERLDDLELDGLRIIQHKDKYCFTMDSVLLSSFVRINRGETAADLGTGSGIVAILLAAKTPLKHIYGIELQPYMADMAARSVRLNRLADRITISNIPMQKAHEQLGLHRLDVVAANPPYGRPSGAKQESEEIALSRHEVAVTLAEVVQSAARLLKYGGRFYLIHRAERLADIVCALRDNRLEPKRLRFVADKADTAPTRVLIEAHDHGKPGLIVENSFTVYGKDGEYTVEARAIYQK